MGIQLILLVTRAVVSSFLGNFLEVRCLTGNKQFDFGADLDHGPDSESFNEFFLQFQRSRKPVYSNNFAGSAAFAEVYALRVMSFSIFRYFRKCRDIAGGRCR